MKRFYPLLFILFLFPDALLAQKKIVVLGSSTAFGTGASSIDSSWAGRLQRAYRLNTSDNLDTIVTNLAVGGYNTYHIMPTGYVPPANRPSPDPAHNVTQALSLNPDIIIINLPSNDIASGFTKNEVMNNFRFLYQVIADAPGDIKTFITTTQPRDMSPNLVQMQYQRDMVDSISNTFGTFSIDFWTDLVSNDGSFNIRPEVSAGDGIHINNLGHRLVFEQVMEKNIFSVGGVLPVKLIAFIVQLQGTKVSVSWKTEDEDPGTLYEVERSSDGIHFNTKHRVNAAATGSSMEYTWLDADPFPGKTYYRLKMIEPAKISYSEIRQVQLENKGWMIRKIYQRGKVLNVEIMSPRNESFTLNLLNSSGALLLQQKTSPALPLTEVLLPVHQFPSGTYFLWLITPGATDVKQILLK